MLHLLTKRRIDIQLQQFTAVNPTNTNACSTIDNKDETIEKIKFGLSKAIKEPDVLQMGKPWDAVGTTSAYVGGNFNSFPGSSDSGFQYELASLGNEGDASPWGRSMCTGSTCTAAEQRGRVHEKGDGGHVDESGSRKETRNGSSVFNPDCSLWDLPSDDLINPIV